MECLGAAAVRDDKVAAVLRVDVGALQRYRSPGTNKLTQHLRKYNLNFEQEYNLHVWDISA